MYRPMNSPPRFTFALSILLLGTACSSGSDLTTPDAGTSPNDAGTVDDGGLTVDAGDADSGTNSGVCGDWSATGFAEASHTKAGDLDYDQVFGDGVVQRLDIVICPADWQAMQDDMTALASSATGRDFPDEKPSYVPVLLSYGEQTWPWVGMRYKGNSTLWGAFQQGNGKLPFRLHFDKFEDDHEAIDNQRFFGFKELKFGNNYNDDSLVRDKLMSETLRSSGIPAAKGTFARIYVDVGEGPVYWGLYTMFEDPTNALLDDWFGGDDGTMYEGDGDAATLAYFDADSFEAKTNEDTATWAEIQALIDALASSDSGATWRATMEQALDMDGYLRTLAINQLIGNWDTYGRMTHNYYFYADPAADDRLVYIPWDFNESYAQSTGGGGGPGGGGRGALTVSLDEVQSDWPLIRRTMDDEVYRAAYIAELADLVATHLAVDTQTTQAQAYHDLIAPYVVGADGEQGGYTHLRNDAAFENSLSAITAAVTEGHRQASLLTP